MGSATGRECHRTRTSCRQGQSSRTHAGSSRWSSTASGRAHLGRRPFGDPLRQLLTGPYDLGRHACDLFSLRIGHSRIDQIQYVPQDLCARRVLDIRRGPRCARGPRRAAADARLPDAATRHFRRAARSESRHGNRLRQNSRGAQRPSERDAGSWPATSDRTRRLRGSELRRGRRRALSYVSDTEPDGGCGRQAGT